MLYPFLIITVCLNTFTEIYALGGIGMLAPSPKIKTVSLSDCDSEQNQVTSLYNINDKGEKALDATIVLDEDFDANESGFTLDVAKWEGNNWQEDFYNVAGDNLCDYIKKYIPKLWTKVQAIIKPTFDEMCVTKKGTYELKKFQASYSDIDLPSLFIGKLKLNFKVTVPDDRSIICKIFILETSI